MYLNCKSFYSFNHGLLSPEKLILLAKNYQVKQLAITDIHNTSAYIELFQAMKELDYRLSISLGMEFRHPRSYELYYLLLAQSPKGFEQINRFCSRYQQNSIPWPEEAPQMEEVVAIYPLARGRDRVLASHEFIGIRPTELNRLIRLNQPKEKLLAWNAVTYTKALGHQVHKVLRAIGENKMMSQMKEPLIVSKPDELFIPPQKIKEIYSSYPFLLKQTEALLERCGLDFELERPRNRRLFGPSKEEDRKILRLRALEGLEWRYGGSNNYDLALSRIEKELRVIADRGFETYFLITDDMLRYAQRRQIAHVGRGSGANSIVAYCMGITDVDPIELDLYFERFLNPYRHSPPDFDIDFSWKHRDTITDYLFRRWGPQHIALLACFNTYQGRAPIREIGKVYGLPNDEIEKLLACQSLQDADDRLGQFILHTAALLVDMPRHLSIHAGGVVITEAPIYRYTALEMPPKGYPLTHFDMMSAEVAGIHKYDVLSQRGLGHIEDACKLIRKQRKQEVDIRDVATFKRDPKIKALLRSGRTIGCFYVESPAMRMLLSKLHCDDYITLVAASSIIRPGVSRSGMMRAYIERHHNKDFDYIHPKMEELMQETYGIMVYQEDVIKVAHHFAGLDLGEADILRRGMSGKFRSKKELMRVKDSFFSNCREKNYPDDISTEVWRQIESFSGYSFSKAHSASYAVESYQSLYLKAHFPLEFIVAVINNFGGFYHTEFYLHEARMNGAQILAPCVNEGDYLTSLKGERDIYLGFIHLKGLNRELGMRIAAVREQGGKFETLHDFLERVQPGLEQARILARIGALRYTQKSRKSLLWDIHFHYSDQKMAAGQDFLFPIDHREWQWPEFDESAQSIRQEEVELLGFTLSNPFDGIGKQLEQVCLRQRELRKHIGRQVEIIGYLVTIKPTSTKNGERMYFGCFIDANGDFFDTTHFAAIAKQYPFRGKGFYRVKGKVCDDFGSLSIEVKEMGMVNSE
ncbi:MAG: DNA polymerase III subunit alpha [Cyclobacteriaceae bacterium]|nr:DNA polymerase III subunit alpha [Cyclobacteriaceae bacterium]